MILNRRQFMQMMGVAAAASVLPIGSIVSEADSAYLEYVAEPVDQSNGWRIVHIQEEWNPGISFYEWSHDLSAYVEVAQTSRGPEHITMLVERVTDGVSEEREYVLPQDVLNGWMNRTNYFDGEAYLLGQMTEERMVSQSLRIQS